MRFLTKLFGCLLVLLSVRIQASPITNLNRIIQTSGFFNAYKTSLPFRQKVKVAILDNGFFGYEPEVGRTLPAETFYHPGPKPPPAFEENHGLVMAQLLTALATNDFQFNVPFELHLYSSHGFSNFEHAVENAIANNVDIILYAQVWEYGGNFDGSGFINAVVDRAIRAGVIWINAAGNFATGTFNSLIKNLIIPVRCQLALCMARIVLSWNDFKNNTHEGSSKNLDLFLTDGRSVVASSEMVQKTILFNGDPRFTKFPREIISKVIDRGQYYVQIKMRSHNFSEKDSLRITASGPGISLALSHRNESLLSPADHKEAITVGGLNFLHSSASQSLGKPEFVAYATAQVSGLGQTRGTSQAAAIVAASAVILKSLRPDLNRNQFLTYVNHRGRFFFPSL